MNATDEQGPDNPGEPTTHINSLFRWECDYEEYLNYDQENRIKTVNGQSFVLPIKALYSAFCYEKSGATEDLELLPGYQSKDGKRLIVHFLSTLTTSN